MSLIISNLNKTYSNGVKALQNINLEINKGMFGLLGPNGAGKTSLMRTIATLQNPDSGSISLNGIDAIHDKTALRKVLGYLPQEFGFYPKVSAWDLLHHFAVLKGISNRAERNELVEGLLLMTNLYEARKRNVSDYSGGMRQRFGIAQALIGNPQLIIVDEPTAGLDPMERNRFHNILSEISEETIIILSTHIVEDVKNLCRQMVIMNKGQILYSGTPKEAREKIQGKIWQKAIHKEDLSECKSKFEVISQHNSEGKMIIRVFSETPPDETFSATESGLEDLYFSTIIQS